MQPKIDVSVIIPVFNAQATIGYLVHELLSEQTLSIEVIVVDDGSTDETSSILSAITDERLILVYQENQGVYAARNAALAVHRGEWVVFLDADDRIEEGFLQARLNSARAAQADVAFSMAGTPTTGAYNEDRFIISNLILRRSAGMRGYSIAWLRKNGRITCGCK